MRDWIPNPTGIGGFKPGEVRNPGGKPLAAREVQHKALAACTEALDVLIGLMRGKGVDKSVGHLQLAAAQAILDRGVGRAGQHLAIAIDLKKRLSELSEAELISLRDRYVALAVPRVIDVEANSDT